MKKLFFKTVVTLLFVTAFHNAFAKKEHTVTAKNLPDIELAIEL